MRPEKSNLLKISLCALSCVFFGCGKNAGNNSDNGRTGQTEQPGRGHEDENAQKLYGVLSRILRDEEVMIAMNNIPDDPNSDIDGYSKGCQNLKEILKRKYKELDGISQSLDSISKDIDDKDKDGKKLCKQVIKPLQDVLNEMKKLQTNPLYYTLPIGKGLLRNTTLVAVRLGSEICYDTFTQRFNKAEKLYKKIQDKAAKDDRSFSDVEKTFNELAKFKEDWEKDKDLYVKRAYEQMGSMKGYNGEIDLFAMTNIEGNGKEAWLRSIFSHIYYGCKSDRKATDNPASYANGQTLTKIKDKVTQEGKNSQAIEAYLDFGKTNFTNCISAIKSNIPQYGNYETNEIYKFLSETKKRDYAFPIFVTDVTDQQVKAVLKKFNLLIECNDKWGIELIYPDIQTNKLLLGNKTKDDSRDVKFEDKKALLAITGCICGLKEQIDKGGKKIKVGKDLKILNKYLGQDLYEMRIKGWKDIENKAEDFVAGKEEKKVEEKK